MNTYTFKYHDHNDQEQTVETQAQDRNTAIAWFYATYPNNEWDTCEES